MPALPGPYFYPRSPCGERPGPNSMTPERYYFYPRSPCGERLKRQQRILRCGYFYPRSPCGERPIRCARSSWRCRFLSTLSLRRATWPGLLARPFFLISIHALLAESDGSVRGISSGRAISIHALLAESDLRVLDGSKSSIISIHALLAESDVLALCSFGGACDFYPRSPCGERPIAGRITSKGTKFLSTLSLRRATSMRIDTANNIGDFYPRSPCGERPARLRLLVTAIPISIHALLAESDPPGLLHSLGGVISIHALLAESDEHAYQLVLWVLRFLSTLSLRRATSIFGVRGSAICNFYPRSPCGERPPTMAASPPGHLFLSTLSLRRATGCVRYCIRARGISIHALLAESDARRASRQQPAGISIHALLAESDPPLHGQRIGGPRFLSTLSLRRATRQFDVR